MKSVPRLILRLQLFVPFWYPVAAEPAKPILIEQVDDVSGVYLDGRDQNCVVAGGEGQSSVWIETPRHYIQFNCTSGRYIHILTQNNTVFYVRCNPSGSTVTS